MSSVAEVELRAAAPATSCDHAAWHAATDGNRAARRLLVVDSWKKVGMGHQVRGLSAQLELALAVEPRAMRSLRFAFCAPAAAAKRFMPPMPPCDAETFDLLNFLSFATLGPALTTSLRAHEEDWRVLEPFEQLGPQHINGPLRYLKDGAVVMMRQPTCERFLAAVASRARVVVLFQPHIREVLRCLAVRRGTDWWMTHPCVARSNLLVSHRACVLGMSLQGRRRVRVHARDRAAAAVVGAVA